MAMVITPSPLLKTVAGQLEHPGQIWIGTIAVGGSIFGRRQQPSRRPQQASTGVTVIWYPPSNPGLRVDRLAPSINLLVSLLKDASEQAGLDSYALADPALAMAAAREVNGLSWVTPREIRGHHESKFKS